MADSSNHPDLLFDSHPEGSAFSNDDFEKLDAPGGGFGHSDDINAAASGAYDHDQDAEISTTTDADVAGEEEAEADQFSGSPDVIAHHPAEPLISWGDDEDDELSEQVQPSAPVPDSFENLVNFDDSAGQDYLQSFSPSVPPTSTTPEPKLSSYNSSPIPSPTQHEEFNEPKRDEFIEPKRDVFNEPKSDESKVIKSEPVSEQKTVDTAQGSWIKGVDPRVIDLIYWRDVKTTGMVFGAMMVVLLSLAICSLLSVLAYLSLAILVVTFSFTVYKKVMSAVQKSNEGHPFKQLIDMDIALKEDKLKCVIQTVLKNANCTASELRRLFLIEDMVDSIKFGLLLWVLTYIGAWFNGMTLVILVVISIFTLPKVYETYKVQIDNYIGMAKAQVDSVLQIVQSKLPFLKKKEKAQ